MPPQTTHPVGKRVGRHPLMPPQTTHLVREPRSDLARRSLRGTKRQAAAELRQLAAFWGFSLENIVLRRKKRLRNRAYRDILVNASTIS